MGIWFVYIISNKLNGVLYIGVTKNLKRRIYQHKNKIHPRTFSARYNLDKLVYYKNFETKDEAYTKERQMKKWNRKWKIELIESINPNWQDLSKNIN